MIPHRRRHHRQAINVVPGARFRLSRNVFLLCPSTLESHAASVIALGTKPVSF
jgi:hypothetical protein